MGSGLEEQPNTLRCHPPQTYHPWVLFTLLQAVPPAGTFQLPEPMSWISRCSSDQEQNVTHHTLQIPRRGDLWGQPAGRRRQQLRAIQRSSTRHSESQCPCSGSRDIRPLQTRWPQRAGSAGPAGPRPPTSTHKQHMNYVAEQRDSQIYRQLTVLTLHTL